MLSDDGRVLRRPVSLSRDSSYLHIYYVSNDRNQEISEGPGERSALAAHAPVGTDGPIPRGKAAVPNVLAFFQDMHKIDNR
jgi:hypothetical protein